MLRRAAVGRLAVVVDGRPDVFPVNFAVDHGSVVYRTAAGTKLGASVGQPVAFEADGHDTATGVAWSVVVKGTAHEVRARDEVLDILQLPLIPWQASPKPRFVRIEPDSVTGRKFPVRAAGPTGADASRAEPTEPGAAAAPSPGGDRT